MHEPSGEARAAWEEHYGAKPRVWSGRVNARLAEIGPQIAGSRALDLGCGEGADAIWLAEHDWTVVAVDISETALGRAREAAHARGVADRIDFRQLDLTDSLPEGPFDLVSAQFLHSTVEMDRPAILRRAAHTLAPGGTLLIVDHAAAPPWASKMHHHPFPSAQAVVAGLDLDEREWERVRVECAERAARGPDGEEVTLVDNVIVLRRTAAAG
ncbi:MAG: class I SAM-dependent methyltransferase [Mycobacterium sp.]|nr:class I SAM-dependent methyltransferase [Mycobacterium sp.]